MGVNERVKRGLVGAFVVFGTVAVLLNVVAAGIKLKNDLWASAAGYLVIAIMIASALVVHWYASHRQRPYRWRDENWGHERWREQPGGADPWRDDDDSDGWRDELWHDDRD